MAAAPDGSIYFAELAPGQIGRLAPDGKITEYKIPLGHPLGLAAGDGGDLWPTVPREHLIYRMTPGGDFTALTLPGDASPTFITRGPGASLYFTEANGKIGRIGATGEIAEFSWGT